MTRRRNAADDAARASAVSGPVIPKGGKVDYATLFPGLRPRHDGWTEARTQRFLDTLAHTGCVEDACRVAGMSAAGARRMQGKYPAFAAVWEDSLARAQQGLVAIAYQRAVEGRETVIIRKGTEYERRIAPSDSMLALLVKRGDIASGQSAGPSDQCITLEEWRRHWRFDANGKKVKYADAHGNTNRDLLKEKFREMRRRAGLPEYS